MGNMSSSTEPHDMRPLTKWGRFKRWMSPKREKKYSFVFFLNLSAALLLSGMFFYETVKSYWHIGVDGQVTRCLPWKYYLLSQKKPETIVKNRIYRYTSYQLPAYPDGLSMGKYLAAVPGDRVRVDMQGVHINGKKWGDLNLEAMKKVGIEIDDVLTEYTVQEGQVLMLGVLPGSIDGRHHGTVPISSIEGRAIPLW